MFDNLKLSSTIRANVLSVDLATVQAETNLPHASDAPLWQQSLQRAVRKVDDLLDRLRLEPHQVPDADADSPFPLLVPLEFIAKMKVGDPSDPLLLQVLPMRFEREGVAGFRSDPVGDLECEPTPGLLHKYPARVLLIANGMCAVHCRYCFRRHFPYDSTPKALQDWQAAMHYIAADPSIDEVILSGGDPLSLGNAKLAQLIESVAAIAHVRRLRIHTRFPVMIPHRIDDGLLQILGSTRLQTWVVLHINHAQEIDQDLVARVARLRRCGACVLNQAVLLRGINDTLETQLELCTSLVNAGIQPYYVHQLDRVSGAAQFETDERVGLAIIEGLRRQLPGYAVPRFVRDNSGELSKTLLQ